jgi:hypothetical protein
MQKMNLHNTAEFVLYAVRKKIIVRSAGLARMFDHDRSEPR